MSYVNIPNSSLSRDMYSKALVETDRRKAEEYKVRSKMLNETKSIKEEMDYLKSKVADIDTIKDDIAEIKLLLKGLSK